MTMRLILVSLFLALPVLSVAQDEKVERTTALLKTSLALTAPQETEVRKVLNELDATVAKDREANATNKIALFRLGMQRLREADTKIEAILTDEQKKKYPDLKDAVRQEMKIRRDTE
jgi:periplasmic protein CpxP/Spy